MEIAYVPVGVPTFDLEEAEREFKASAEMLKGICADVKVPDEMLLSIDKLDSFLSRLNPDLVIFQNVTFANAAYCAEALSKTDCPFVLWTLREPQGNGGRLKLNSLTGAFSAGNMMHEMGRENFAYIFGSPDEDDTRKQMKACIDAAFAKVRLSNLTAAAVGHTPEGFGFGRAIDADLRRAFGVKLISIEARELMKKAEGYADADLDEWRKEIEACDGIEATPRENVGRHLRLRKAYADFIKENNVGALASRCWPDFFTEYKTPVCAVLSFLNDAGISTACEGDMYGAISMYVASSICGSPVFFGDPVAMDEKDNTITFWHCGMAATKLAQTPALGVHPNRKMGPVMDFGCKAAKKATMMRIGRRRDGSFRLFVADGEILDAPKQFQGTSLLFKAAASTKTIVQKTVKDGWEPHYVVAPADIADALACLAKFLRVELYKI